MQDNRFMNTAAAQSAQIDTGLRSYMLGVYNHMTTALLLTGFFAFAMKWAVMTVPAVGQLVYGTPLKWVVMLAPLGMVFWLSARMNAMSATKARNMFYIYGALMGLSLASILFVYTGASVARAFFITAGAFAGLSLYGYSTKRSLSAMGSFMVIGLFGLIIASVVNIFMASSQLEFVISVAGVLIFAGLTAWDTQRIKAMYMAGDSSEESNKKSIFGALMLYLDFINMFLFILRLFGNRE
ncbi:Bax inhibitor-1/YccA family protein [Candidatus Puniceispirillum marinum]|uniref:Integral membrane protein, interacts with FtsH n=1 Tax=Puniceispirillum marinum (strain IMCC1322) TaxID=488538 RepID=D5BTR0_PUNMI|nr:Bax inhibitor-1/YccA family protein [Candidatus Puniceispirillum marinum]ADE39657.1 Integral membrane protein, interacts with FtsH [Candidatus Puniceispirillum marinum IMCC1322]